MAEALLYCGSTRRLAVCSHFQSRQQWRWLPVTRFRSCFPCLQKAMRASRQALWSLAARAPSSAQLFGRFDPSLAPKCSAPRLELDFFSAAARVAEPCITHKLTMSTHVHRCLGVASSSRWLRERLRRRNTRYRLWWQEWRSRCQRGIALRGTPRHSEVFQWRALQSRAPFRLRSLPACVGEVLRVAIRHQASAATEARRFVFSLSLMECRKIFRDG